MKKKGIGVIECIELPQNPDAGSIYRLLPKNPVKNYYDERTDRNIGWITEDEQEFLHKSVIGVAGCGGMGGLLASVFLRLGAGEVRIADCEDFDASNINRQFAATRCTVGKSKAFETARMLRAITDDTHITVYPQGISDKTAEHFLTGCDVVCDLIEFWAVGARILLHREGRKKNITLISCDTVGHRTYIYRFDKLSGKIEDALGLTFKEAAALQKKIQSGTASAEEISKAMDAMLRVFVPEIPEYSAECTRVVLKRLEKEKRASILATNPPMASGFLANHVLFYLLRNSGSGRKFKEIPAMPGYLGFDAAELRVWEVKEKWWGAK